MKKIIFSLSLLMSSSLAFSQTVLLDENFDSYTDFAITGFGNWLTLDLDQRTTYTGGATNPSWPNAGSPMAFQIFNPTTAGVTNVLTPTLTDPEVRNFTPHSGQKFAACWDAVPSGSITANNDWLISPAVTLGPNNNNLSLWVKSLSDTYGLEKYKIGVYVGSGVPTAASNFTIISGSSYLEAPYTAWEQNNFSLDAYSEQTIRIGIQCISDDIYMFMVDDVRITTGTLSTNDIKIKKDQTNIFPNPTKGELNIKTDKKIKSYNIIDQTGKLVLKSSSEKIDISALLKGNYIIQIEFTDGTTKSEKIMKQ